MHVPDGIVPIWLQAILLLVSIGFMYTSYKKIRFHLNDKMVPYMGILAAVIFTAQLVNFPVPPFSSGHLVGSTLLAILVGPYAGLLIIALVLFVQALYGDGGILTYGLNLFNMGVLSVFLGYGLAMVFFRTLKRFTNKESSVVLSAAAASFIVTVTAAFVLGLELFTVPGFSIEALGAITGVHVIIGIGEAILTAVILGYFVKANPKLVLFLREERAEEELSEDVEIEQESLLRQSIPVMVVSVALAFILILFGLASENPDGFEWALFVFAGVAEPEHGFEGIWAFLEGGPFLDVLTALVGIVAIIGIGYVVFQRAAHQDTDSPKKNDIFLLPFGEGKPSATRPFSAAGMIVSAIILAIIISIQSNLTVVWIFIGLILVSGWITGTRWGRVFSLAAKFELLILFWIIFEPFLYGSTVIFSFVTPLGTVFAYSEGLLLGFLLGSRMFAILLTFLAVLSHMTLSEFIAALRTLKVPTSILGSLLIMFRYIPLFLEERSRMQDAQLLRGFSRGRRFERIRSLGNLVGTTINRSFDRSVTVYEAMSLRGFGKGYMVSGSGFRGSDILLPVLILLMLLSIPYLLPAILEVIIL